MKSIHTIGLILAIGLLSSASALGDKGESAGSFTDRDGKTHVWEVRRSHALYWDGGPYVPVGVAFQSAYLKEATEARWTEDERNLDRLQAAGVRDLWIDPARGLLSCPLAATQRLLDALEQRGFRYGLAVQDRHREPLVGLGPVGPPVSIAAGELRPGATYRRVVEVPDARRVYYALVLMVDPVAGDLIVQGSAPVVDGKANLEIALPANRKLLGRFRAVLWLAAERELPDDEAGGFADLWDGAESYQAQLLGYLHGLKFGPGLRFILNPFDSGDGLIGAEDSLFPMSAAFRTAFQQWLKANVGVAQMDIRWGLGSGAPRDLATLVRLVPTWAEEDPPDGAAWLIDPEGGQAYPATPRRSRIWQDLRRFRADTLRRMMNAFAVALKQGGVDLPVLFEWDGYNPLFSNTPSPAGYDGLGCVIRGHGPSLAAEVGSYALAQAEEADRNTWLVATRMSGPLDERSDAAGYAGPEPFRQDCSALAEVGFRGFFVDAARLPGGLEAAAAMAAGPAPSFGDTKPAVCFYPALLPNTGHVTRLSNGVWWLPSTATARQVRMGDQISGYEIEFPFGRDHAEYRTGTVLWSPDGPREATFFVRRGSDVVVLDAAGQPLKARPRDERLKLTLAPEPIVVVGLDAEIVFPVEEAAVMIDEMESLLRDAERQRMEVSGLRLLLREARSALRPATAAHVHDMLREPLNGLRQVLSPYTWIEGERPLEHNFLGIAYQSGLSDGAYLKLDRLRAARRGAYRARYVFHTGREATYEVWIAGGVPGAGASPLSWTLDGGVPQAVKVATPVGEPYARGCSWYSLGKVALREGRHILDLVVTGTVGEPPAYRAGIDVIVLARAPFQPQGIRKPYPTSGTAASPVARPPETRRGKESPQNRR
ncbi:MAG: hypothetical protein HY320_14410 [Armatimonadetes bacterium]|nr:hypothetical protein [Armatimonadota bacterium]